MFLISLPGVKMRLYVCLRSAAVITLPSVSTSLKMCLLSVCARVTGRQRAEVVIARQINLRGRRSTIKYDFIHGKCEMCGSVKAVVTKGKC